MRAVAQGRGGFPGRVRQCSGKAARSGAYALSDAQAIAAGVFECDVRRASRLCLPNLTKRVECLGPTPALEIHPDVQGEGTDSP